MALNGKYELVKSENHLEFLIASGVPEDRAKTLDKEDNTILEISITGNNVSVTGRNAGHVQKLILDQEVKEEISEGRVIASTASLNGDKLTIVSSGDRGEWKRVFALSGSELVVAVSSQKAGSLQAKKTYKKL